VKERGKKSDVSIFPQDPLERCNLRWEGLFWGIWSLLNENDKRYRRIKLGIVEALKKVGLFDNRIFESALFERNPTDEILRKTLAFRHSTAIPNLRGKKLPWEKIDPFPLYLDYLHMFAVLNKPYNNQPLSKIKNPVAYKKIIRERLSRIIPNMIYNMICRVSDEIPERVVNKCIGKPMREVVITLVAHIYGEKPDTIRKYLTEAKKNDPILALFHKQGMEMIMTQNTE
jgi:hypothetical protein